MQLAAVLRDRTSDQTLPENQILQNVTNTVRSNLRTSKSATLDDKIEMRYY
jgi:hypothetical protein